MKAISSRTRYLKKEVPLRDFLTWKRIKGRVGQSKTGLAKWKGFDDWIEKQFSKSMYKEDDSNFIAPEDNPKQSAEDVWRKTKSKVTTVKSIAPVQVVDVRQLGIQEIKLHLKHAGYKPSQLVNLPIEKLEKLLVETNPKKYKVSSTARKNVDTFGQHMKVLKQKANQKQLDNFIKNQQPLPLKKLSPPPKPKKKPSPPKIKIENLPLPTKLLRSLSGDSLPVMMKLKRSLSGDSLPGMKLKRSLSNDSQPSTPKVTPHLRRVYDRNNEMIDWFKRHGK